MKGRYDFKVFSNKRADLLIVFCKSLTDCELLSKKRIGKNTPNGCQTDYVLTFYCELKLVREIRTFCEANVWF